MPSEITFTKNNPLVDPLLWSAEDEHAAETEIAGFVNGLVQLLKPKFVIETGCYTGGITLAIADAIKQNGRGEFYSCDSDFTKIEITGDRLTAAGLNKVVHLRFSEGKEQIGYCENSSVDFAFVDSGYDSRKEEVQMLIPKMSDFGIILLHDTGPQHAPIASIPHEMEGMYGMRQIYLNIPRGLTIMQKL